MLAGRGLSRVGRVERVVLGLACALIGAACNGKSETEPPPSELIPVERIVVGSNTRICVTSRVSTENQLYPSASNPGLLARDLAEGMRGSLIGRVSPQVTGLSGLDNRIVIQSPYCRDARDIHVTLAGTVSAALGARLQLEVRQDRLAYRRSQTVPPVRTQEVFEGHLVPLEHSLDNRLTEQVSGMGAWLGANMKVEGK